MTVLVYDAIVLGWWSFAAASAARAVRYARSPIHLRWEVYPVPHEAHDRAGHGGSSYESRASGGALRGAPACWAI